MPYIKGRPPGGTGMAQCVELFEQLRGAAVNQVNGARIGLAHNIGGPTAVSAVTIVEGGGSRGRSAVSNRCSSGAMTSVSASR